VGVADTVILPVNGNRIGLLLPPSAVANYFVDFDKPAVLNEGILIATTAHPVPLDGKDWGCTLQRSVHAISGGAAFAITVLELLRGETPTEDVKAFLHKVNNQPDKYFGKGWKWKGELVY
jgi:hypothetical protein